MYSIRRYWYLDNVQQYNILVLYQYKNFYIYIAGKVYCGIRSITADDCKKSRFEYDEKGAIAFICGNDKIGVVNKDQSSMIKKILDEKKKYYLTLGEGQTNTITKLNLTYK